MKCNNCGGELRFEPEKQKLICDYCNSEFDAETYKPKKNNAKEIKQKEQEKIKVNGYMCTNCGAKLLTYDETAITFCSYCGSSMVLDKKIKEEICPDYIIPFSKTKEECIEEYKKKISKSLFAPSYMKSDIVISKFRGIFMPYEIYKVGFNGNTTTKGEKFKYSRGDYDYYDDYTITFDADANYEGLSKDVASKYYDKFSSSIPFDFREAKEFKTEYTAGFYADSKDVSGSVYSKEIENICNIDTISHLRKYNEFRKYGCHIPKIPVKVIDKKVGMFPVYFVAVTDKKTNTAHYAVINGQTGKVAVDLPIDFKKYIIYSLILALIIFLVLCTLITPKPTEVIVFEIIIALISLIISNSQLNKVFKHQNHNDDSGMLYVNKSEKKAQKMKFKDKFKKGLYKPILSILLSFGTMILNPVDDIYYYVVSIISFILIIWSFNDLVKEHNELVTEKLPQLEKRGGDERD